MESREGLLVNGGEVSELVCIAPVGGYDPDDAPPGTVCGQLVADNPACPIPGAA